MQKRCDVVRESQEAVELGLSGLLRHFMIEVPRIPDVSGILEVEMRKLPKNIQKNIPRYTQISKSLRRDRELDSAVWLVGTLVKVVT